MKPPNLPEVESRFIDADLSAVEFRAADPDKSESASIKGYAAVYYDGTPKTEYKMKMGDYTFIERVMPGAFNDKLLKQDVRALFNHDRNLVLGRNKAGTLRLSADICGLAYEIDLPDTSAGRDTGESVKRGDITGSSFGFVVDRKKGEKFIEDTANKTITREINGFSKLIDVSPVTFPAYTGSGVSTRDAESFKSEFEAWKAEIREDSPDNEKSDPESPTPEDIRASQDRARVAAAIAELGC